MVLLTLALNHLYTDCAADSVSRTTLGQQEALQHLDSSAAVVLENSLERFEVVDWATELAKKRVAYGGHG